MDAFLFGLFGGLAINLLRLAELANVLPAQRPATFRDPYYLIQFICLPLIGGGLAYTYHASGTVLSPILSLNIGASAPLILKNFASALPSIGPRRVD